MLYTQNFIDLIAKGKKGQMTYSYYVSKEMLLLQR